MRSQLRQPPSGRGALSLIPAFIGVLLFANPANALLQGGYNQPTRQLENGFKVLATERISSRDECYPVPEKVAVLLRRRMAIEVSLARSLDSVQGLDLVNVVRQGTKCNRLILAMRNRTNGRLLVLDSDHGPVYSPGEGLSEESLAAGLGPLRNLRQAHRPFEMNRPDGVARFQVACPPGTSPLGGGMFNRTPLAGDGEGIYPHSYERLGVQNGFHATVTLADPSPGRTAIHRGGVQVICGHGLVPTASPHATTFVRRHATGTVTAYCPTGTQLLSGGFQRTNFTTPGISYQGVIYGGNYITESRAVGTTAWRVSAGATGRDGGELTAIAYCAQDPSLPLTEVSSSVQVYKGAAATATTSGCPSGRALIAGGFSFGDSHDALVVQGYFNREGSWSATGYGWFGPAKLTAYGYCAEADDTVNRSRFPEAAAQNDDSWLGGNKQLALAIGVIAVSTLIAAALRLRAR